MSEIWKPIKDFENLYEISNLGRIRNIQTNTFKKTYISEYGYVNVSLYKNKKHYNKRLSRLLAEAFIPNIDNKPTVDHIDRNKQNNEVSNLRWASYVEQANNKDKTNIIENMKKLGKKKYPNRAEKIKQYDINGNFIKEYNSSREAGKLLNISEKTISSCVNGHSKTAGGFIWKR